MAERTVEYDCDAVHTAAADTSSEEREAAATPAQPATVRRKSGTLRQELSARNLRRADGSFPHETTFGNTPSVLYQATADGVHGNFFPASYRCIQANPAWAARLQKSYTASKRVPHAASRQRHELDCASSSDALLMNVFCHPSVLRSKHLQRLLGIRNAGAAEFGFHARVPLRAGHQDRTEFDLRLACADGDLLVEAKLSETDFQTAREPLMARYEDFEETFRVEELARECGQFRSYQLLRSVLVARRLQARFAVVMDARRTDLLEDVFLVYRAVRLVELRSRLHVVTWQEIAACVPRTLQAFLQEKYGIAPAR